MRKNDDIVLKGAYAVNKGKLKPFTIAYFLGVWGQKGVNRGNYGTAGGDLWYQDGGIMGPYQGNYGTK